MILSMKSYYLYNFDSLISKDDELLSFNPYTGYPYTEITYQNQLITIVNVLAAIYDQDMNKKPFSIYSEFINKSKNTYGIYDNFIQFLMGVKNEP